jgi:uncharacterized membrane protein YhaH (DUF805 family)
MGVVRVALLCEHHGQGTFHTGVGGVNMDLHFWLELAAGLTGLVALWLAVDVYRKRRRDHARGWQALVAGIAMLCAAELMVVLELMGVEVHVDGPLFVYRLLHGGFAASVLLSVGLLAVRNGTNGCHKRPER